MIESLSLGGRLLFVARAVRTFALGSLSVVLALFLARRGLSSAQIGFVFTTTMVEDALLTMLLSSRRAERARLDHGVDRSLDELAQLRLGLAQGNRDAGFLPLQQFLAPRGRARAARLPQVR